MHSVANGRGRHSLGTSVTMSESQSTSLLLSITNSSRSQVTDTATGKFKRVLYAEKGEWSKWVKTINRGRVRYVEELTGKAMAGLTITPAREYRWVEVVLFYAGSFESLCRLLYVPYSIYNSDIYNSEYQLKHPASPKCAYCAHYTFLAVFLTI